MDKNYKQIEFFAGNTVEQAVNELLDYKKQGKLVSGEFNGVTLYSDTVTMDSAYKEIVGKTKAEFDQGQQEWKDNYDRQKQEHKNRIPTLAEEWMRKGREILSSDKWEYWDKIVPVRLNDLYQGMELGACLDIVKTLKNNGSLAEAKIEIEKQGHSGMSFGLVCSMVMEFSERGSEFVEFVR